MTTLAAQRPFQLVVHPDRSSGAGLAADVRHGLSRRPKELPPKYFYDEVGSRLFERITELPEYYQARTELRILESVAPSVVARHRPVELVELGSGTSRKAESLLKAMTEAGGTRYVPFDVCPEVLLASASRLSERHPGLDLHAIAGDFERHLAHVPELPDPGIRLVAFLGSTIGNLHPAERGPFLRAVADVLMAAGDLLLVGTDLAGDPDRLVAAYDDAAGVTAEFNLNVLRVLNRELGADFELERFEHVAIYDPGPPWIEMRLRAREAHVVQIPALGMRVRFSAGEELRTEISCKFTPASVARMLADAGLTLCEWHVEPEGRFAVSLAAKLSAPPGV